MKARNPLGVGPPSRARALLTAGLAGLVVGVASFPAHAQTASTIITNLISREVTVLCGSETPGAPRVLVSREVTTLLGGGTALDLEQLVSREVTCFTGAATVADVGQLVSREVTCFTGAATAADVGRLVSREWTLLSVIGGATAADSVQLLSRELTMQVGAETAGTARQLVSREVSVVGPTLEKPSPVWQLVVNPIPAHDQATLSWAGYNEWAELDIIRYDIYMLSRGADGSSRLALVGSVPAGTLSASLTNLPAGEDHFFAVVAVDALQQFTTPGTLRVNQATDGTFSFLVDNPLGAEFVVLESADLRQWAPVQTNTAAVMPYQMTVVNLPGLKRFYRVLIR